MITSIGIPAHGQQKLEEALQDIFSLHIPEMGRVIVSDFSNLCLLRLADNQLFLVSGPPVPQAAVERLELTAYLTDQSDAWVMLSVVGENCRKALAHICPVDLHPAKFPVGKVVRTLMEHLGGIIYRQDNSGFTLLAPSSSAVFFLHALEAATKAGLADLDGYSGVFNSRMGA